MLSSGCCQKKLVKKPTGPRLINLIPLPFAYMELSTFLITSKFNSRKLINKEITESSLGMLIYIFDD